MTRPDPVRSLRTAATMAYPAGRLLALRDGRHHVLAPDGWIAIGTATPPTATRLTRPDAVRWCAREGISAAVLDEVPALG
ncbi:hypothetical protein [Actinokineospora inagensis]|uniref:hypothetical protein n=1 Tax=Actinokineospora inagensis TaxID=103730 RepID=UPI001FE053E2|nr:hypothetical protein [Actinokineospora inagensis]